VSIYHFIGLLKLHGNSLAAALVAAFPEHDWKLFRFQTTPHHLFEDWSQVESFVKFAEERMRVKERQDWYRVSLDHLWRLGGGQLVAKNGGLYEVPLLSVFAQSVR